MSDNRRPSIRIREDVSAEQSNGIEDSDEEYAQQLRQQKMAEQKHVHQIRQWFIYGSAAFALFVAFSYLWHLVGFPCLRWLKPEELSNIKDLAATIIVGVSVSLGVSDFLRRG